MKATASPCHVTLSHHMTSLTGQIMPATSGSKTHTAVIHLLELLHMFHFSETFSVFLPHLFLLLFPDAT